MWCGLKNKVTALCCYLLLCAARKHANGFTQVTSPWRKQGWSDGRQRGRGQLRRCDDVSRRSWLAQITAVSVCVCVCLRGRVGFCALPLSSMSTCQNKLITITGAKAGIQKFISSTICIASLSSQSVCVCVCAWQSWLQALRASPTCSSSWLLSCGWIKMLPLTQLKVRAPLRFMFKELRSEKQRLTITATKAWPTGRAALIELKLSLWIDHCVNFRINTVLFEEGALQRRRGAIWNLSHGPFSSSFISPPAAYSFSDPCLSVIIPRSVLAWGTIPETELKEVWDTEQEFVFMTLPINEGKRWRNLLSDWLFLPPGASYVLPVPPRGCCRPHNLCMTAWNNM